MSLTVTSLHGGTARTVTASSVGPNVVSPQTATALSGVLVGDGKAVGVAVLSGMSFDPNTKILTATGGGGGGAATYAAENRDSVTFAIGAPMAVKTNVTGVERASAANSSKPAVGLASVGVAVGVAESVQFSGTITKSDWTSIAGTASLSAGSDYYLSPTAGLLTATRPTTPGQVVQQVGRAVTANSLLIEIGIPILL